MLYYLAVCTDQRLRAGGRLTAREIVEQRLAQARWPIYWRTRHRSQIAADDVIAIYVGGKEPDAKVVIATARVAAVLPSESPASVALGGLGKSGREAAWLSLDCIQRLRPERSVYSFVERLSFVPKNRLRWGAAFIGGLRELTGDDWALVVGVEERDAAST